MSNQSIQGGWRESGNRLLTFVLAAGLLLAVGGVVYVSMTPTASADPFTEFYILGANGEAANYPTDLAVGETGELTVGITNHESTTAQYTVVVLLDGEQVGQEQATLADGETWERQVSFTPSETGTQKLQLLLFQGEAGQPAEADESLRLWVEVT